MQAKPQVSIQEFQSLDLRIGTITGVEPVKGSKKLYKIKVDLGGLGERQTVAGLVPYYKADELVGKKIVFLTNLKPARLAGELSEGMILAAENNGKVSLLTIDREIPEGSRIL
ncbi:MAG: methionine--tRNA ligase subunit beta [Candidatus Bathyarchaeia archaeon]|nr:methionine--tRNA ligase subunit beta [Candidatus Bathyarchaeota archaeon]